MVFSLSDLPLELQLAIIDKTNLRAYSELLCIGKYTSNVCRQHNAARFLYATQIAAFLKQGSPENNQKVIDIDELRAHTWTWDDVMEVIQRGMEKTEKVKSEKAKSANNLIKN